MNTKREYEIRKWADRVCLDPRYTHEATDEEAERVTDLLYEIDATRRAVKDIASYLNAALVAHGKGKPEEQWRPLVSVAERVAKAVAQRAALNPKVASVREP